MNADRFHLQVVRHDGGGWALLQGAHTRFQVKRNESAGFPGFDVPVGPSFLFPNRVKGRCLAEMPRRK